MELRTFGYLAPSLSSDSTKVVKLNTAILLRHIWNRLLAATLVNRELLDAHPDLPQLDKGQVLWADALSRKDVRGEII